MSIWRINYQQSPGESFHFFYFIYTTQLLDLFVYIEIAEGLYGSLDFLFKYLKASTKILYILRTIFKKCNWREFSRFDVCIKLFDSRPFQCSATHTTTPARPRPHFRPFPSASERKAGITNYNELIELNSLNIV